MMTDFFYEKELKGLIKSNVKKRPENQQLVDYLESIKPNIFDDLRAIEKIHHMHPVDDETLANTLGMDLDKTRQLLQLRNLGVSLDAPRFDDDEGTLLDTLSAEEFGDTEDSAEQASLHRFLEGAVDELEQSERRVVIARWGLHQGPPLSRAEIAESMGVSREWVRQLERSALRKLKQQESVRSAYQDYNEVGGI